MHRAVLLNEVTEYLNLAPGKKILDCTLGSGGHARSILEIIAPQGKLIGLDCDDAAIAEARNNLSPFKDNLILVRNNFKNLKAVLEEQNIESVDGILFDLGISSNQLQDPERGFSFRFDGPIDMRMDRRLKHGAEYIINSLSEHEISEIIRNFGEERFSRRIARAIVAKRPLESTRKLREIILKSLPYKARHGRIDPATRTFQALRIAVNRELDILRSALDDAIDCLAKDARIPAISFHSLEDRIVKHHFKECEKRKLIKIITKKPITPEREEVLTNPRSRSAKLRVAQRL